MDIININIPQNNNIYSHDRNLFSEKKGVDRD